MQATVDFKSGSVVHVALEQVLKGKTTKAVDKREVKYCFTKAGCAKLT